MQNANVEPLLKSIKNFESIKSSVGPFCTQGPMRLHRLHSYKPALKGTVCEVWTDLGTPTEDEAVP